MAMSEEWRDVVGHEGLYEVSDRGRVIRTDTRRAVTRRGARGYVKANLRKEGIVKDRVVHRLVLAAFVGPCPDGMECRHLNGIRDDNQLANLAWGTRKENMADKVGHGTSNRGSLNGNALLTEDDVRQVLQLRGTGTARAIGERYGVAPETVFAIWHRRAWRHVQ